MQRFQQDRPMMVRRWRQEWENHGRDFGDCHCGLGMGTMRKHRPYERHPSSSCRWCAWERAGVRRERRTRRYAARELIQEQLHAMGNRGCWGG
jgi:hypothetical protein